MKTQSRHSPNVWHGLLFLHGHLAEPALARALSDAPAQRRGDDRAVGLLQHLRYRGGRPMHPGHNFDVEEAFDAPVDARCA